MLHEKALTDSSVFPQSASPAKDKFDGSDRDLCGQENWMDECRHLDVRPGPLKRVNNFSAAVPACRAFLEDSAEL